MKRLLLILSLFLPWRLKWRLLNLIPGYEVHPTARVGLSWVEVKELRMGPGAVVHHFSVLRGMDLVDMQEGSFVGKCNLVITPQSIPRSSAGADPGATPEFILEPHAFLAGSFHIVDCSDSVLLGPYSLVGGYGSKLLTHWVDVSTSKVRFAPVRIGRSALTNTNCIIAAGSIVPPFSVVGAKAFFNAKDAESHHLYAGVPARPVKPLEETSLYFTRRSGPVPWIGTSGVPKPPPTW